MKYIALISLFFFITSCHRETTYDTKTLLINAADVDIKLIPYQQEIVITSKIVTLNPKERLQVMHRSGRGKGGGEIYIEEIYFNDSVNVTFGSNKVSPHYNHTVSAKYPNLQGIHVGSNRSLYKRDNYVRKILFENKRSIENEYTYTFTNQDYLDAQK